MDALKEILKDSFNKRLLAIEVVTEIPRIKILIHDSRTMTVYGIDESDQLGFTISISLQIKTNVGKKINQILSESDTLDGFILFNFRERLYIKDFGTSIESISEWLSRFLSTLKVYRPNELLRFFANGKYIN